MANKKQISAGLSGLLNPQTPTTPVQENTPKSSTIKVKETYKLACYSLPEQIIENIKYIAYYDRKKQNAVIIEAMNEYIAKWNKKPHGGEQPKVL